jgi:hypothetical protein
VTVAKRNFLNFGRIFDMLRISHEGSLLSRGSLGSEPCRFPRTGRACLVYNTA